jgi:hypothetical protein
VERLCLYGRPDGELEEDEFLPPAWYCDAEREPRWRPCEDDDENRGRREPRAHGLMGKINSWMDSRSISHSRAVDGDRVRAWHRGESSYGRTRAMQDRSPPPSRVGFSPQEKRVL